MSKTPFAKAIPATLTPQAVTLLDYFKAGKELTALIAIGNLGIGSYTKRVAELRAAGHEIVGKWKKDHKGKRYMSYSLPQEGSE